MAHRTLRSRGFAGVGNEASQEGGMKRWLKAFWERWICAEDDDPGYLQRKRDWQYHEIMKDIEDTTRLREIMQDAVKN